MSDNNPLLEPSLDEQKISAAPYSTKTGFVTSFFGAGFGAIIYTGLNSLRLQRLKRDLPFLIALTVAYVAIILTIALTEPGIAFHSYLKDLAGKNSFRYFLQVVGIVLFGLGYLLHRREHRSADFMGLQRPNGWMAGLAILFVTIILHFAIIIPLVTYTSFPNT